MLIYMDSLRVNQQSRLPWLYDIMGGGLFIYGLYLIAYVRCNVSGLKKTLPKRKKICDNKHVEKVGIKMTREGRGWDTLIKQFIKREYTESVNKFYRKHNVGVAELQAHYKQSRQDSVGAVVEVKSQKRKQPFLQLEVNGVRIKVTPDTDK